MRFDNDDRTSFVLAVIGDVPQEDYDGQAEALVTEHFRDLAPECIREAVELCPDWVEDTYCLMPGTLRNFYSKFVPPSCGRTIDADYPAMWKKLEKMSRLNHAQNQKINALKQKVRAAISSCTTLKQAKERLPEFEKYLPAERLPAGTAGAPMVANVVTDLMNAGWPKENRDAQ